MLSIEEKINFLEKILLLRNESYGDFMKDEIYFYFFENEQGFKFLNNLNSKKEIETKVDFLVSKMIMHEHEEGLYTIIEEYA